MFLFKIGSELQNLVKNSNLSEDISKIQPQFPTRGKFPRSGMHKVFYKKAALENFAKFVGKHLCQSFFSD